MCLSYQLPRRRYAVYWDMYAPAEWTKKETEIPAPRKQSRRSSKRRPSASCSPGQMQAERDANQQGEGSAVVRPENHFGRNGTKWFSFDLPVDTAHPLSLVVTYSNDNTAGSACDVLVDGKKLGGDRTRRASVSPEQELQFTDVEYAIPADLVVDKEESYGNCAF